MTVLFVVGAPGVGKTTMVRLLLPENKKLLANPKWTIGENIAAAGHYVGGAFDGADTVPYNGAAAALAYWEQFLADKRLTIFDGDRFSNSTALAFFRERSVPIFCAHLKADPDVLAERLAKRGSKQNASWMKGRLTKAENFANSIDRPGSDPKLERCCSYAVEDSAVLAARILHDIANWSGQ